jgi:hypothetical protein
MAAATLWLSQAVSPDGPTPAQVCGDGAAMASVQSGDHDDPATWGGAVPRAQQFRVIAPQHTVTQTTAGPVVIRCVRADGPYMVTVTNGTAAFSSTASGWITVTRPTSTQPTSGVCSHQPNVVNVSGWPLSDAGARRLTYSSAEPVARVVVTFGAVSSVTVTDGRGCDKTVTR